MRGEGRDRCCPTSCQLSEFAARSLEGASALEAREREGSQASTDRPIGTVGLLREAHFQPTHESAFFTRAKYTPVPCCRLELDFEEEPVFLLH